VGVQQKFQVIVERYDRRHKCKKIVLVDDFSGTGDGLVKLVEWINKKSEDVGREALSIYAAFVGCMPGTFENNFQDSLSDIFFVHVCERAISDSYSKEDAPALIVAMKEIESRHGGIRWAYSLGYKQSEATFCVQNLNTPNNVLPIFWSKRPGKNGDAVFPRLSK
jgi:hypothetical protein